MKNLKNCLILFLLITAASVRGQAQEESRIKITMSVMSNGKEITPILNTFSTLVYKDFDGLPIPVNPIRVKGNKEASKEEQKTKNNFRTLHLNISSKNLPDDMLKIIMDKKNSFNGTITIIDNFGKIPTRIIKFFDASMNSFTDQYSAVYYGDSVGSVSVSIVCKKVSINGIQID